MLTEILQNDWGFEGMVVTDWGANNNRVDGIKAGQNLEMPSTGRINIEKIKAAVNSGELSMEQLDKSVARVLGLIVKGKATLERGTTQSANLEQHHSLAREAAEQGAVLLKNDANMLPLAKEGKLCVMGALAKQTRYQGSGSSQINPFKLEQPLDEITKLVGESATVSFAEGYGLKGDLTFKQKSDALAAAVAADTIILFVGLTPEFESEGFDREHMDLPRQQRDLIKALQPFKDKLVIVLQNGAPIAMPFAHDVPAILEAYLGGQAGASALANILFGEVNPSGKLAETMPVAARDCLSDTWFPGNLRQSQYREGIWVGYRYFDTANIETQFPFGHGLSYTQFEYSDLVVSQDASDNKIDNDNYNVQLSESKHLNVSATLTNIGKLAGYETVQLYVGQHNPCVPRPKKELRNFAKVWLEPGESTTVHFSLDERDFAYWNVDTHQWQADTDEYTIYVSASITDIRLQQSIALQTAHSLAEKRDELAAYFSPKQKRFNDAEFSALLGHSIPKPVPVKPFHCNSAIEEVQGSRIGRKLKQNCLNGILSSMGELPEENRLMMEAMVNDMPLRNLSMMSEGKLPEKTLHRLIHLMNGDWIKAVTGEKCESK